MLTRYFPVQSLLQTFNLRWYYSVLTCLPLFVSLCLLQSSTHFSASTWKFPVVNWPLFHNCCAIKWPMLSDPTEFSVMLFGSRCLFEKTSHYAITTECTQPQNKRQHSRQGDSSDLLGFILSFLFFRVLNPKSWFYVAMDLQNPWTLKSRSELHCQFSAMILHDCGTRSGSSSVLKFKSSRYKLFLGRQAMISLQKSVIVTNI